MNSRRKRNSSDDLSGQSESKRTAMPGEASRNNNSAAAASGEEAVQDAPSMTTGQELSTCSQCGRNVPRANLVLHETRCNGAQANPRQIPQPREETEADPLLPTPERGQNSNSVSRGSPYSLRNRRSASNRGAGSSNSAPAADTELLSTSRAQQPVASTAGTSMGTATFAGNIQPPAAASVAVQSSPAAAATRAASAGDQGIVLGGGQWQCPRCTLINNSGDVRCDACLAPRNGGSIPGDRPPDSTTNQRLIEQPVENGWVNVTYNPQFQRGATGIGRVPARQNRRFGGQNPLVYSNTNVGTAARVFNGLVNGAIVGSVFAGGLGMIVGGLAGAAGGVMVDRVRQRDEQNELRETRDVANMLVNDDGGIQAGTVRVHRGNGFVTALASDSTGRGNRVIRVRYGDGLQARRQRIERSGRDAEMQQQVLESRDELERSLLDILVRMSYSGNFGPGPGNNVILQPEETFEELIQRFGLGTENRGASQEVIDSYPVEVVGEGETEEEEDKKVSSEGLAEGKTPESEDEDGQLGTCNICLEDYVVGDQKKTLSCPAHPHCFHKDCIDKWLKVVASCPICKSAIEMYKPEGKSDDKKAAAAS